MQVLKLPGKLSAEQFLDRYWQNEPLFMPQAVPRLRPSLTRNELAWLAMQDDVESRIVFTERGGARLRYRAETGPFDARFLSALPKRDWTLLVHDVEKHLPAMRKLFGLVPFIPDWRIDDLMVSFAAPGGGVGPHRDNYDVFLCQGIGVRDWRVSADAVEDDPEASRELSLTREFSRGGQYENREGDVLYLPPGVVHWGTASRACITYSIGMRAPQVSDLGARLPDEEKVNPFYADPDLAAEEALPGFLSPQAIDRARRLMGAGTTSRVDAARALGRAATATKDWLTPECPALDDIEAMLDSLARGTAIAVHGMARLAYDDMHVYVNGRVLERPAGSEALLDQLCRQRRLRIAPGVPRSDMEFLRKLLESGVCAIPGNL